MRRACMLAALWAVLSTSAGCRRDAEEPSREEAAPENPENPENTESPENAESPTTHVETGLVKRVEIDTPETWWTENGFVELHAPILLPTNMWKSDLITVWMMVPEGKRISWVDGGLRYPEGTISDRVEFVLAKNAQGTMVWTVFDVRGTRIGKAGTELFHVYRPVSAEVGAHLKGFEWPRGNHPAQVEATERLVDFMRETPVPLLGRPLPGKKLAQLGNLNNCAPCHEHRKALSPRDVSTVTGMPRGATDGHGFFHPLRVLADVNAVEIQRAYDLNIDDPLVTVRCGTESAKVKSTPKMRIYVCPEHQTPLGERDMKRGIAEKDPHSLKVCDSRRYLFDRMTEEARAQYTSAFEVCGVN